MVHKFFDKYAGDIDDLDVENRWAYRGELDLQLDPAVKGDVAANHLDHISKSRIKTALTCLRKFGYKYLADVRAEQNYYMERGSTVHDAYEKFHNALSGYIEEYDDFPERFTPLMKGADNWFQFAEYIGPFFRWELQRLRTAMDAASSRQEAIELWEPHSVEVSLTINDPPVGNLPWLGPYDALVHAASMPMFDADEGYVVIDYKTGSVKDEKYRDEGIHIDLEFYSWMLEKEGFDVVGGVGMYPTDEKNVVRKMPNPETRKTIATTIEYLNQTDVTISNFTVDPQPLCDYCYYQDQCPTTW